MPPTTADRLRHIGTAVAEIISLVDGRSEESFCRDRVRMLALERLLEVVSEASRYLPDALKSAEPEIPWRRIADLGNRLRHAYHQTDPLILWNITQHEIVQLSDAIARMSDHGP